MRQPGIDDQVRLLRDIPQQKLYRGEIGIVRSMWCAPQLVYEVEFDHVGLDERARALLVADQVEQITSDKALSDSETDEDHPDASMFST